MLSPEKFSLVGSSCSQTSFPLPAFCWGHSWIGRCAIFPSSQGRGHFGVVLALVRVAYTQPCLWSCFRWIPAKGRSTGEYAGRACGISKVTLGNSCSWAQRGKPVGECGRGAAAAWANCPGLGWSGRVCGVKRWNLRREPGVCRTTVGRELSFLGKVPPRLAGLEGAHPQNGTAARSAVSRRLGGEYAH